MTEKLKQEEQMKQRLRQLKYRNELDSQLNLKQHKHDINKVEDMTMEQQMLAY